MTVNRGILDIFSEDLKRLLERVKLNGLVLDGTVYLKEEEVEDSLFNLLSVYNITDRKLVEEYYEVFKEIKDYGIVREYKEGIGVVYYVEL